MKTTRFLAALVMASIMVSTAAVAFAAPPAHANNNNEHQKGKPVAEEEYISLEVEELGAPPDGEVSIMATTRTVRATKEYKSLAGIVVVRHIQSTWWTFSGGYLYSSPRGIDQDWWTAPLNYISGHSKKWDWYTAGSGGTGQSNGQATFVFGVPTPWGPVGSTMSSRIKIWFNGSGSYKVS